MNGEKGDNGALQAQIIILGGGIAGLWLLNRLCSAGYDAILLEQHALGSGQTLASQGIIHGGLKYALNGVLSPASSAIADMPERWRRCLAGEGEIDLRACNVLSPHYYMWSNSGYRSRLKTFLGSKALRGRIDLLRQSDYPDFFAAAPGSGSGGSLYRLTDFVVDTPSLLTTLSQHWRQRIFKAAEIALQPAQDAGDETSAAVAAVEATGPDGRVSLRAERYLLCAGEGNEALLQQLRASQPLMQRRPLHMVWLKLRHPHPAFVHCIGDSFGMTPRLTVTSHPEPGPDGLWTWYLGGELAESGVRLEGAAQIEAAQDLLSELFPWVDTTSAEWGSFFINRAEPRISNLQRPDTAWLGSRHNYLVAWPTKLTLCPDLGDAALDAFREQQFMPACGAGTLPGLPAGTNGLEPAGVARTRWEKR